MRSTTPPNAASSKVIELRPRQSSEPAPAPIDLTPTIHAAQRGDADAMQTLVAAMLPRVRNLVRYLVRGDDIDDLSQDALLKVLERLGSYRAEGRFESWVDGVTLRVTLRALSKRRAEARRKDHTEADELAQSPHLPTSARYVSRRRAVQALDQLPDAQRHALVMHHVLGMTANEISAEISVPMETVRSRLRLGMGQLRAVMGVLRQEEDT